MKTVQEATLPVKSVPAWTRWSLRGAATLAAVMLFDQAVFAGQFLSGVYPALDLHRENATLAGISVLLAAIAAVLHRWPGGGPWWPIVAYLALFGLIGLQISLGFARTLAVHVPLGVSIIMLAVALAVWAWVSRWPR